MGDAERVSEASGSTGTPHLTVPRTRSPVESSSSIMPADATVVALLPGLQPRDVRPPPATAQSVAGSAG